MGRPSSNRWLGLAAIGGMAYPLLVYFGSPWLPPGTIVVFGLTLIGLRLLATPCAARSVTGLFVLAAAGGGLAGLLYLDPHRAALVYPIVVSLATATIFGLSLIWPPTVIERMVRIREPNLTLQGAIYIRKVTVAWTMFLIANATVSTACVLWGTLEQWTLWNGLISYLLMGMLFLGEIGVRRIVRRHEGAAP